MATAIPIRLPWRAFVRSTTKCPSSHFLRASQSTIPSRPNTRTLVDYSRPPPKDEEDEEKPERVLTPEELNMVRQRLPPNPNHPPGTAPQSRALDPEARASNSAIIDTESSVDVLAKHDIRLPRSVQAVYLRPLKRTPEYGVPTCDLQLRSYSIRNLEFFCDFALRAAYYLGLPASGPVPLPRIVERWTVPRGSFIAKKSQENFERRTVRRLIQIKDGDAESQEIWLAFLRKHAYYGIGMKANVWEFSKLNVGSHMDTQMENMKDKLDQELNNLAFKYTSKLAKNPVAALNKANSRQASGESGPMMDKRPKGLWPVGRTPFITDQNSVMSSRE